MVQVTAGGVSGNTRRSRSDKTAALGVPDSPRENRPPNLSPTFSKPMSLRERKRETSWAPGGSIFMADLEVNINITSTTSTNPPRRNSTPLPSSSSRHTTILGSTLNPRAVEFFPSNLIPTPQPNKFKSDLKTGTSGNPVPAGCPSEKEAEAATRDQLLSDAAYAATLYLEELKALDPSLELEEAYRCLFLEEVDVARGDQNEISGTRKVALPSQFLKLQEDAFGAFKPGGDTEVRGDASHMTPPPATSSPLATLSPPHIQQYEETVQQLGSPTIAPQLSSEGIPPKPGPSTLYPSVPSPPQDTSTNDSAMVMITADLSSPEVATYWQAAARSAGEEINKMEQQLHMLEQRLEGYDTGASDPLAPQLKLLRTEYRRTKMCSLDLALKISNYSRRFPETMIPNCLDNLIPLSERKDALEDYINDARGFATASEDIAAQWALIQERFLKLTDSFSNWGLLDEVAKLGDLGHLKQTMADLEAQMESSTRTAESMNRMLTGATLMTIAITSIGLWKFREASGNLVKFLHKETTHVQTFVEHSGMFGILSAGIRTVNKVAQKPQEIRERSQQVRADIHQEERQIRDIRARRGQLEELASNALTLSEVIVLCDRVWAQTRNDAVDLRAYLESGAQNVNRPSFLRSDLGNALRVYTLMASYLRQYADAIRIG